jgi:hypothetical protein
MKLQVLNGSFGKALAVATIAFMISSAASAQGQQGRDRCFHSMRVRPPVRVPRVPPVYMYSVPNGGRPYHDYRRSERPSLTRQRSAGMAADQEVTRAGLLQIRDSLANLLRATKAHVAAQQQSAPRAYQGPPPMSQEAKANQEQAGQLLQPQLTKALEKATLPNDTSATPKPNCSLLSGNICD